MLALQILIDGFAISSLYGVGAVGFTLMFGVCGVLNLAHGGIMLIAGLIGWWAAVNYGAGPYGGAAIGVLAGLLAAYVTYFLVVRPLQRSRAIPKEEEEIFILTGTLLWGIMIQVGADYLFSDNPVTLAPMVPGVMNILGVRTPRNEVLIAIVCWAAIGLLYPSGEPHTHRQAVAGGIDQSARAYAARLRAVAHLPDRLDDLRPAGGPCGCAAGVVLRRQFRQCRRADRERLHHRDPGRARQRAGFADCRLCRGLCRNDHRLSHCADAAADPGAADPGCWCSTCGRGACSDGDDDAHDRGRRRSVRAAGSPAALVRCWHRRRRPRPGCRPISSAIFTVAFYFGVFAMSWDLLFGFAGEVNFGPTFLIGLGAYGAGLMNNAGLPIPLCLIGGAVAAVVGGLLLALPALRLRGPYFGLITLVAVLLLLDAS